MKIIFSFKERINCALRLLDEGFPHGLTYTKLDTLLGSKIQICIIYEVLLEELFLEHIKNVWWRSEPGRETFKKFLNLVTLFETN